MNKTFSVILIVAICFLSFVCYKQNKQISALEYEIRSLDRDISDVKNNAESEIDSLKDAVSDLEGRIDDMESGDSAPPLTREQKRQEAINRINRFNEARNEEISKGITNNSSSVDAERRYLSFLKKFYDIDILIK